MTSSIYPISVTATSTDIPINTDILTSDIVITKDQVKPGGGGILRLYFSFTIGADAEITILNNDILKGNLNADNNSKVISNGYYRFDIDVEEGDSINLQSDTIITTVNFIRVHLIQFGA